MLKIHISIFKKQYLFALILVALILLSVHNTSINYLLENNQQRQSDIIEPPPKCENLYFSNAMSSALSYAESWTIKKNDFHSDSQLYQEINESCSLYLLNRNYSLTKSRTNEEDFIIAFAINVFESAPQFERLFRAIFRPWNYYCVHIDKRSNSEFIRTVTQLVNCINSKYNNIINTANRVDTQSDKASALTADLNCMKELYNKYKDWKYLINLTGQDFPLKTNAELVKILKAFKGANNLEGTYKRRNEDRVPIVKMPFPVIWFKGSTHATVNRKFVKFIFESPKSKLILETLQNTKFPDEQFFATLNYNAQLKISGSYIGDPDEMLPVYHPSMYFLTTYSYSNEFSCQSNYHVNGTCILGIKDLPNLIRAPHLFASQFHINYQPAVYLCLEKWFNSKVDRERLSGRVVINESFYASMPFVKYQYIPPISE